MLQLDADSCNDILRGISYIGRRLANVGNFRWLTGGRQASARGGGRQAAAVGGHIRRNEMQLGLICAAIRKLTPHLFPEGGKIK